MTSDELVQLTVKDLRALAERHGIAAPSKVRKDQLIALLLPHVQAAPAVRPLPAPEAAPAGSSVLASIPPAPVHQGPDPGLPIPDRYGIDRIVLLVQDPHHIFAYWEVSAESHQRVCLVAGDNATPVLILEGVHGTEQREIDLRGGNYYLTVAPGGTYRARLALRSRDGRLHALCADSNVVATPAIGPSERHDEAWMEVDEHFHELLERSGSPTTSESSLNRLLKRHLSAREVALGEEDESSKGGDVMAKAGIPGGAGNESSAARLGKRAAVGGFSSHSLLSSHALVGSLTGSLSSHTLSSHSLSSHSLSSTVFSSHSRWQTTRIVVENNPGLPDPVAASPVPTPQNAATTNGQNPPAPTVSPAGTVPVSTQGTAPVPAAPIAVPPPRPGQIRGLDTIKSAPPRRRPR